ncbi:MAG: hypothetical protein KGI25_00515 [Thaumarchaeota archaeon]|nr:hypothetical protein [Nitrososphaerota archaeon]
MIPKGATICFVIGVVGAGMLGAYLFQISNQVPTLVYQNGPSLSIIPNKINYRAGELVHIRIIDSGTTSLLFSDSSFGLKIRGLDGTIIYSPPSTNAGSTLSPHQEKIFVWNQTRTGGGKVFEGRYKIESNTSPDAGNELKKSVTINIFQ